MSGVAKKIRNPEETRQRLLEAAVRLVLRQGFSATTVDQICAEAGLTKGSFFHHFKNKEEIGREATGCFAAMGGSLYAEAWKDPDLDPLEQIHRLLEIMAGFTVESDEPCVCMVGMMSQEMAGTNPAMREACAGHLGVWTEMVRLRLEESKGRHRVRTDFDSGEVAWFLNSLWQGSMLIAKTRQTPQMIRDNLRLAREYIDGFFDREPVDGSGIAPV